MADLLDLPALGEKLLGHLLQALAFRLQVRRASRQRVVARVVIALHLTPPRYQG
ncbi:hypothetical protein D3C85_1813700 [compost metagenome]